MGHMDQKRNKWNTQTKRTKQNNTFAQNKQDKLDKPRGWDEQNKWSTLKTQKTNQIEEMGHIEHIKTNRRTSGQFDT